MVFDIGRFFYKARIGLSSEAEVKYNQLNNAAEAASEAAKSCEKLDKVKNKAKKDSLASKVCTAFSNDLDDMLG